MSSENSFLTKLLPVASNLVFVIPWLVAIVVGNSVFAVLTPLIIIASTMHHVFKPIGFWDFKRANGLQTKLFLLDVILVIITVGYIINLFWEKGFPPTFWYSVTLGLIGLFFYSAWTKRYYKYGHAIWHTVAASIITIALL